MSTEFPAAADDGGAAHLARGQKLPDIALPATRGEPVNFARREGWTFLYVYPWTGRPGLPNPPDWDVIPGAHGSTPQAESFRNLHTAFRELGGEVFGVSAQSPEWQKEFAERMQLPFTLASDETFAFQRALRLPTFETGGVTYLKRLTLAVLNGRIEQVFYPVHPPEAHPREVLVWFYELVTRERPGKT